MEKNHYNDFRTKLIYKSQPHTYCQEIKKKSKQKYFPCNETKSLKGFCSCSLLHLPLKTFMPFRMGGIVEVNVPVKFYQIIKLQSHEISTSYATLKATVLSCFLQLFWQYFL